METYTLSFSLTFSSNPWFNHSSSEALQARSRHIGHENSSLDSHSAIIYTQSHCRYVTRGERHSFIQRKCNNLSSSPFDMFYYYLTKGLSYNFTHAPFLRLDAPMTHQFSFLKKKLISSFSISLYLHLGWLQHFLTTWHLLLNLCLSLVQSKRYFFTWAKARRVDQMTSLLVYWSVHQKLAPMLAHLFSTVKKQSFSFFLDTWVGMAYLPPPKKKKRNDRSKSSSYRPINLTSTISIVFKSPLSSHFHLESHWAFFSGIINMDFRRRDPPAITSLCY